MMSLRARIFIFISIIILIILGISIFLFVRFGKKDVVPGPAPSGQNLPVDQNTYTPPDDNSTGPVVKTPVVTPPSNFSPEEIDKNAAKQLAKVFIERYGTYSSDNGSENVKEIKNLVTPALWATLSARVSTVAINENQAPNSVFTGMNTQVFSAELKNWASGSSAMVSMQLIRTEEKNGTRTTDHQNVEVEMIKQGSGWLVQNFKWI